MAGGKDDGSQIRGPLSSVLMLLPEGTSWTPLASLPQALTYVRASIVGVQLWINGGFNDGSQDEVGLFGRCKFAAQKVKFFLPRFFSTNHQMAGFIMENSKLEDIDTQSSLLARRTYLV